MLCQLDFDHFFKDRPQAALTSSLHNERRRFLNDQTVKFNLCRPKKVLRLFVSNPFLASPVGPIIQHFPVFIIFFLTALYFSSNPIFRATDISQNPLEYPDLTSSSITRFVRQIKEYLIARSWSR